MAMVGKPLKSRKRNTDFYEKIQLDLYRHSLGCHTLRHFSNSFFRKHSGEVKDPLDSMAMAADSIVDARDTMPPTPEPTPGDTLPKGKIGLNCKPCDIDFLNKIDNHARLSEDEMDYLICTMANECANNFDFLEFHNAQMFKFVTKQPLQFGQRMMYYDTLHWELVAKQLGDPVVETYSTAAILKALDKANQESSGALTRMISILKYHFQKK